MSQTRSGDLRGGDELAELYRTRPIFRTMGPKVPNKWVSKVERMFSYQRSLGGHHCALGVGHDAGGEDKGDVYLRHRDKTFVVAIGSGIMVQSCGLGH